jgi:superfamily I DNA/RNA helicase
MEARGARLTDEQMRAVQAPVDKPLMVVAIPGAGKTTALVYRVLYLVNVCHIHPHSILVLTFTRKAVAELISRLHEEGCPGITVKTLHGFGYSVLQDCPVLYKHAVNVVNEATLKQEIRSMIQEPIPDVEPQRSFAQVVRGKFPVNTGKGDAKKKNRPRADDGFTDADIRKVLQWFEVEKADRLREELGQPSERLPPDVYTHNLQQLYEKYDGWLKKGGWVRKTDLVVEALQTVRKDEAACLALKRRWAYCLLDEAQDTHPAEAELIMKLFVSRSSVGPIELSRVAFFGDDDQAIYEWRGASAALLRRLQETGKWLIIPLTKSHRLPAFIASAARGFIDQNDGARRITKKWGQDREPERRLRVFGGTEEEMLGTILDSVREHPEATHGILVRKGSQEDPVRVAFGLAGVPLIVPPQRWCDLDIVRLVHGLCFVTGAMPFDPFWVPADVQREVSWRTEPRTATTDEAFTAGGEVDKLIAALGVEADAADFIREKLRKYETVGDFLRWVKQRQAGHVRFGGTTQMPTTQLLATQGAPASPVGSTEPAVTGVKVELCTTHKAKGREWDYVYMFDASEGQWPPMNYQKFLRDSRGRAVPGDIMRSLEEERRVFYVAMTRAKVDEIILFNRDRGPSMFINAIQRDLTEQLGDWRMRPQAQTQAHGGIPQELLDQAHWLPFVW